MCQQPGKKTISKNGNKKLMEKKKQDQSEKQGSERKIFLMQPEHQQM